jgi:hypothetical protein
MSQPTKIPVHTSRAVCVVRMKMLRELQTRVLTHLEQQPMQLKGTESIIHQQVGESDRVFEFYSGSDRFEFRPYTDSSY